MTGSLYHYTTIDGLHSIIKNKVVWATDIRFMNDTTEGTGRHQVARACGRLAKTLEDENLPLSTERARALRGLKKDLSSWLSHRYEGQHRPAEYATCFSRAEDQLSQWRGYATGGYCIEFDEELMRAMARDARAEMRNVEYVKDDEGMRDDLLAAADRWLALDAHPNPNEEAWNETVGRQLDIMWDIEELGVFRKSDAFEEEQEVRILTDGNPDLWTASDVYGLVPRRELKFPFEALTAVWVGPSPYQAIRVESLEVYAEHHFTTGRFEDQDGIKFDDYAHRIQIKASNIPYR